MEEEKKKIDKAGFQDEESSFNIMEWVTLFVSHWYLFAIGLVIALSLSYLQNRKWLPEYKTSGTVIIDESRSTMNSAQVLMQGFGIQESYRNVSNQVIMIGSNDLLGRVVDSLPNLQLEYISKGRFKTRNLYDWAPIVIQTDYVSPDVYELLFKINISSSGDITITEENDNLAKGFIIKGKIGQPIQHRLFFLTVNPVNDDVREVEMYFRYRARESLISEFSSRLQLNYVMEGSSVLEISLSSETPQRDVDFINKLCDIYLMSNLERKNDAATKTINFIDEQLINVSRSLSSSEDNLTDFRKRNQIIDVGSLSNELMSKATAYDNELNQVRLKKPIWIISQNISKQILTRVLLWLLPIWG